MYRCETQDTGRRTQNRNYALCFLYFLLSFIIIQLSDAEAVDSTAPTSVRIKDIARISCAYDTQLHGYGLVVGLDGTGDSASTTFTTQSVLNMMERFGISVPAGRLSVRNVAAVIVTAELPFLAKFGSRIDVLVSSLGDAKSIASGTLLPTPLLCAADGQMYVLAQGAVSVATALRKITLQLDASPTED